MFWDLTKAVQLQAAAARQRALLEAQAKGSSPTEAEKVADAAAAQAAVRLTDPASHPDASTLPHEFGHYWFVEQYWPGQMGEGHYGGPAPDWLDEIAAILHETEASAAARRKSFRRRVDADGGPAKFLRDYLSRDHPMRPVLGIAPSPGSRVIPAKPSGYIIGPEGSRIPIDIDAAFNFYAMGRIFADFMIEKSGNERIFAEIADALAKGASFEEWLRARGAASGIGSSPAELDRNWTEWLDTKHPKTNI
ncbi:MAG TPA: hypothetical protein VGW38_09545 [Chloroflexota bacterium]|nr:hypothetical protein [Chloroflexota bacterium]